MTKANGSLTQRYRYSSFGVTTHELDESRPDKNFIENRYGFTGREIEDEAGLYYYRARYFDPELGRFISEDSLAFSGGDINFFGYVGNSPLDRTDPGGEDWTDSVEAATQFTAGFANSASFGLSNWLMEMHGDGNLIDKCSDAYKAGVYSALAVSVGRMAYAGAVAVGTRIAKDGIAANALRNTLKGKFRFGLPNNPKSYADLFKRYGSDRALKDAAGRTNPGFNSWAGGAGLTSGEDIMRPR